ncbi:MAG: hypothetical protein ACOCV7_02170 [Desulfonatronovibrionaceae bacterium]
MIISSPEQHLQALMNTPGSSGKKPAEQIFEMIMNKNLATAPPSALAPGGPALPPGLFAEPEAAAFHQNQVVQDKDQTRKTSEAGVSRIRMAVDPSPVPETAHSIRQKIDFRARAPEQIRPAAREAGPDNNNNAQPLDSLPFANQSQARLLADSSAPDQESKSSASGFESISTQSSARDQVLAGLLADSSRQTAPEPANRPENRPFAGLDNTLPRRQQSPAAAYKEHAAFARPADSSARDSALENSRPGQLAARFESHGSSSAIGYDRRGGTCYGIYQLSSRRGTMGEFLDFLDDKAPDISSRLRNAGPADSGGKTGAMPMEWKVIAADQPERLADLQHQFIEDKFYRPAAAGVGERLGLDMDQATFALREVLWSTAVQHGVYGAMDIFQEAGASIDFKQGETSERRMIQAVYDERRTRFSGSTQAVQAAVQNRFNQEMQMVLAMLPGTGDTVA